MKRSEPKTIECHAAECQHEATIIHRRKPYCGKHALKRVDDGERPDTFSDFFGSHQPLMGMRGATQPKTRVKYEEASEVARSKEPFNK